MRSSIKNSSEYGDGSTIPWRFRHSRSTGLSISGPANAVHADGSLKKPGISMTAYQMHQYWVARALSISAFGNLSPKPSKSSFGQPEVRHRFARPGRSLSARRRVRPGRARLRLPEQHHQRRLTPDHRHLRGRDRSSLAVRHRRSGDAAQLPGGHCGQGRHPPGA